MNRRIHAKYFTESMAQKSKWSKSLSRSDKILVGMAVAFSVWVLMFVFVASKIFDTFGGPPQVQEARKVSSMEELTRQFNESWEIVDLSKSMAAAEASFEANAREKKELFRRSRENFDRMNAALEEHVQSRLSAPLKPIWDLTKKNPFKAFEEDPDVQEFKRKNSFLGQ